MQGLFSFIPLIYLLVSIPYVVLGLYSWSRRPAVAVTPFAWMMVAMAVWSFGYYLEILTPNLNYKLVFIDFEYLGIASLATMLFAFALEYTGKNHLLTGRHKALLSLFPILIIGLTWTNNLHGLMWTNPRVEASSDLFLLNVDPNFFYWLNVVYSYILLFVGTLLLVMEFLRRPGSYRLQISFVIVGLISPWVGNIVYLAGWNPIPNLDLTPLFFIPTSFALAWAITRYRLLDVLPLEHVSVLQNMRDGVIVVDSLQRILYLNPIAEMLLGRSEVQAIGQPLNHVSEGHARILSPLLIAEEGQYEVSFPEHDNASFYEVTISPMRLLHEPLSSKDANHVMILHDITLRKEAEAVLERREAIMAAISLAAEQFLREPSWGHNIPGVLERIGQAAGISRIYVFRNYTDDDGGVHTNQLHEWAAPGIAPHIDNPGLRNVALVESGFGRWVEVLGKGRPIYGLLRDFPEQEQNLLRERKIISMAVMPIFVEQTWWGFIGFDDCAHERVWTAMELEALHTVANIFGSAETRVRTEQKLLRRQHTLNLLQEIVLASLKSVNITSMAEVLVEQLGKLINADGCFLTLWDETHQHVIPLAAYGPYKNSYPSMQPQPGEKTLTASALDAGHTLVIEDVKSSRYVSQRIAGSFSSRSVLALPMIAGTKRLGAIMLAFDKQHRFQPEEIAISEQAANLITLALEKFQTVEHAQRQAEESETLRRAGAAVSETLLAEETVTRILDQLAQVIPYDSASVQIIDGNELEIIGGRGWDDPKVVVGLRFPIPGKNPNTVVIQTGQPYILSEAEKDFEEFRKPPHDHIHSWLGVPLIAHQQVIGLLAIDSAKPNHFSEENIELAAAFANQVAIALVNARLFKETQTQAITDPLTNIYNRRGLFDVGELEFSRARRINRPFTAIMLDIDHFKEINDAYGHPAGDVVLQEIAARCKKCVREIDFIGRYGGEEIIILLPDADRESALHVAERLRLAIANSPIRTDDNLEVSTTVSLGVAQKDENTQTLETLIARADQAMYIAKHKGRNRVAISV